MCPFLYVWHLSIKMVLQVKTKILKDCELCFQLHLVYPNRCIFRSLFLCSRIQLLGFHNYGDIAPTLISAVMSSFLNIINNGCFSSLQVLLGVIDTWHCVHSRCTGYNINTSWNDDHNNFSEHLLSHTDIKEKEEKVFSLVMRTQDLLF